MSNDSKDVPPEQRPARVLAGTLIGLSGVGVVGMLDWSSGTEISLSILYMLPIGLAVWIAPGSAAVFVSIGAAAVWLMLDLRGGARYSHPYIPYWNALVRLGFFLLTAFLLNRVRSLTRNLEALIAKRTAALVAEVEQRKQAEEVARESEIRFRQLAAIVENAQDAIISKTCDGRIISWNRGAERLFGYTAEEVKGRSISFLIPPELQAELQTILKRIEHGERTENFETIRLRKDGTLIHVSLTVSPMCDEAGRITGASVIERDITEQKRLEREIAEISRHEQQRLAHDLHDHLGAYLAGIAFRVKALAENLDRRAVPEAHEARQLVGLINQGTDQVRNFARLLAPVEVANGGLPAGLSRFGAEMETLFGIICRVEVAPDLPELTDEQGTQLYSIAQEAARNAVKHGKARQVEISVTHVPGRLIQSVRNDGQAWDVSQLPTNHLGLRIMHYRAGTIDGTLTLRAESDGRTTVVCQVPLAPAARSESPDPAPTLPNFLIHEENPRPGGG